MAKAAGNGAADAKTTSDVAKLFGVTSRAIARICSEHGIGTVVNSRLRILTAADVEKIRPLVHGKRGNPNFGKPSKASPRGSKRTPAKDKPAAKGGKQ